ncbi:MAG: tetratricopeptide repeat protein [Actinobacteria bacterium]|nr:MAG: tetratricopeptide repeat protein [Actinomycetota bacterium]
MERKLATVLFVDLVEHTQLVTADDPEIVRRRITAFFDGVSRCIETHGGTVEKFAGDAVMAAFGIPLAHEDDAERAVRAAMAILDRVHELELEARIGVESGEVVVDEADSTFATGEAVNVAARLQQAARPGEILLGLSAHRLTQGTIAVESAGPLELRGFRAPIPAFRPLSTRVTSQVHARISAPFIGRDTELELLENTLARTIRDRRPHVFTVYGDPGVGKSRLVREFVAGAEGTTILSGRALPYGEGVTYWPLAEMVKAAAGITDDDPIETAREKLLECCGEEAIAELLGLASGVLDSVEGERGQPEIAWAAREFVDELASVQPLILVFEDIHWAEEPLLELIDHLAQWVRDRPLLILCLARPELLDVRPGWGGGRVRSTSIELEPLDREDTETLADALLAAHELSADVRDRLLGRTEGNPLFVEETVRMVLESGDGTAAFDRIPDSLQALIAARIDRLPGSEKMLLQRASVLGRVFAGAALVTLSPDFGDELEDALDDLIVRDLLIREERSGFSGEIAYRFKHVLIREVAYSALSKSSRAEYHQKFAEWLRERADKELLEIRAYHLDQACLLLAELDGRPPLELAQTAAHVLEVAGKRALTREANQSARKLLLRAVELEPTLERRYNAARAAWKLGDLGAVALEMSAVEDAAERDGNHRIRGRALTALAEATISREGDVRRATEFADQALAVLDEDDFVGRFGALDTRSLTACYEGRLSVAEEYETQALEAARKAERKDLESKAALELASIHISRLEEDKAEPLIERACELAEASGSILARAEAARARGELHRIRGEYDEAEEWLSKALDLFTETGSKWGIAHTSKVLGRVAVSTGDTRRAEKLFRESIRLLAPMQERGTLCESQRLLAQLLLLDGHVDEAEKFALAARETVSAEDVTSRATTRLALAQVRAAQGRHVEAESLFQEAIDIVRGTEQCRIDLEVLPAYAQFLRDRDRLDEAVELEARLAKLAEPSAA